MRKGFLMKPKLSLIFLHKAFRGPNGRSGYSPQIHNLNFNIFFQLKSNSDKLLLP